MPTGITNNPSVILNIVFILEQGDFIYSIACEIWTWIKIWKPELRTTVLFIIKISKWSQIKFDKAVSLYSRDYSVWVKWVNGYEWAENKINYMLDQN